MILPKEKAKELVDKFKPLVFFNTKSFNVWQRKQIEENAKQCASIAVNLHLEELDKMKLIFSDRELHYKYWQEVKKEIEKL